MKKLLLLMTIISLPSYSEVSANVSFTSDYIWRGMTQSDGPAIQGGFEMGGIGVDLGYVAFDYPKNETGLDFEEIVLGLSMGDLGLTFAMGQDGAPDYTEVSYGIGDFGVSYGQYDDYGDNLTMSYGFSCGSYDCGIGYSDFSDDGYGADEDGIYFSVSASL